MAVKDYYQVLGVPRDESPAGLRAAYREMVKRHHPDAAGTADSERFREITEAYEILSDPERRRYYNQDLQQAEGPPPRAQRVTEVEPLTSPAGSMFGSAGRMRPPLTELFHRYEPHRSGSGLPHRERGQGLNVEVVLTSAEALRGGTLPMTLPVQARCPVCHGSGARWPFWCHQCRGRGFVERQETVRVQIHPRVRPGTVIEVPLRGSGIHQFYLRVHVLIGGHWAGRG